MTVAVSAPIMALIGIPSLTATSAPATETPTSSARSSVRNLSLGTRQWISPLARHFRRRGEHVEQRLQGIALRQPVYQRDHTPGVPFPQLRLEEIGELLPQLLVGDGVLRSACSMPDVFGARLAAIERDGGLCLGLPERTVLDHQDAVAQLIHVETVDLLVGELLVAGGHFYPGDSPGESDAELAFQPRTGLALVGQLHHQRMHAQLDPLHLPGGSTRGTGQRSYGIYCRMGDDAAGVRLDADTKSLPPLSQRIRECFGIRAGRGDVQQTTRPLEALTAGGVAIPGEQRREDAVGRRIARVERFGHRSELHALSRGPCGGDGQCVVRGALIKPEEARAGCGCTYCSGGSRDVPSHVVVCGAERECRTASRLDAESERSEEVPPARPLMLGQRKRRRERGTAGVEDRG